MLAGGQVVSLKYTTDHDACYRKIQCSTLCGSIVSHSVKQIRRAYFLRKVQDLSQSLEKYLVCCLLYIYQLKFQNKS